MLRVFSDTMLLANVKRTNEKIISTKRYFLPLGFRTCRTVCRSQIEFGTIAVKIKKCMRLLHKNYYVLTFQNNIVLYLEVCVVHMFKDQSRGS